MELDNKLKQKITKDFLENFGEPIYEKEEEIYDDLYKGLHSVNIIRRGKFTIAEIKYCRDGYEHHFLGVAAKNPNDEPDINRGIIVATEKALYELLSKFYLDEYEKNIEQDENNEISYAIPNWQCPDCGYMSIVETKDEIICLHCGWTDEV
jgi:hypothetical protein